MKNENWKELKEISIELRDLSKRLDKLTLKTCRDIGGELNP